MKKTTFQIIMIIGTVLITTLFISLVILSHCNTQVLLNRLNECDPIVSIPVNGPSVVIDTVYKCEHQFDSVNIILSTNHICDTLIIGGISVYKREYLDSMTEINMTTTGAMD